LAEISAADATPVKAVPETSKAASVRVVFVNFVIIYSCLDLTSALYMQNSCQPEKTAKNADSNKKGAVRHLFHLTYRLLFRHLTCFYVFAYFIGE
jgi:hypothetical protein